VSPNSGLNLLLINKQEAASRLQFLLAANGVEFVSLLASSREVSQRVFGFWSGSFVGLSSFAK